MPAIFAASSVPLIDSSINTVLFFQHHATAFLDAVFTFITILGEQEVFIAVICFVFWNISRESGITMGVTLLLSTMSNIILKLIWQVPRPYRVIASVQGKRLTTAGGYALPSGHTQSAATFYLQLNSTVNKRWYALVAVILPLLVGLSRIYLGVHWPLDTALGYLLGFCFAIYIYPLIYRFYATGSRRQLLSLIGAISFAAVSLVLIQLEPTSADAAENVIDLLKTTSLTAGLLTAIWAADFTQVPGTGGNPGIKVTRYLVGLLTTLIILAGSKLVLPDTSAMTALRYFLTGIWAFGAYPYLGQRFALFSPEDASQ